MIRCHVGTREAKEYQMQGQRWDVTNIHRSFKDEFRYISEASIKFRK